MAQEAMEICLQVLKESNKSRFDNDSVRNGVSVTSLELGNEQIII